jgi:hypothetical protein
VAPRIVGGLEHARRVYGYNVVAIRVERTSGGTGPLQIDNLDGQGYDLLAEWQSFFRTTRSDHVVRARRYWQTIPARRHAQPGSPHTWGRLDVEYGPNGIPGRVFDTAGNRATATVRPQDATVHRFRHLLARPRGGAAALLAAEVIGRSRAFKGPVDAFRRHLETAHADLRVEFEYLADGDYWEEFLARASLISATLTRQTSIPGYTSGGASGQSIAATMQTTIKATGRGLRLPSALLRPLLERRLSPRQAFGVSFDPERTSLLLESEGQRRQVYLEAGEPANLVYPIGDPDRRDQPPDGEFFSAASETLGRLLSRFPA